MLDKQIVFAGDSTVSGVWKSGIGHVDGGTGKITEKEMLGIKHYALDVADPNKRYSVIDFKNDAESAISEIVKKNKIPIIAGGTGFYIQTRPGLEPEQKAKIPS